MQNALEGWSAASAGLYSELAFQTATRAGMWKRQPDRGAGRRLDRAGARARRRGSPARAKALAAVALWRKDEAAARALHAIAKTPSGNAGSVRKRARGAATSPAASVHSSRLALWLEERLALVPGFTDPDDCHFAYASAIEVDLAIGHLPAAAERSVLLMELVEGLTPHHRLHGVDSRIRQQPRGPLERGADTDIAGRAGSGGERGNALCWNRRVVLHPRGRERARRRRRRCEQA